MDIFFVDISDFYTNERPKNSKLQHEIGRNVLAYLLRTRYNIEQRVCEENGKPFVQGNPIYFSISHSQKFVGIAFDKTKVGLDIEFKKKRNYKAILEHFNITDDVTEDEFFQMWTVYEAEYKSGIKENLISFEYENYMVTVSFENKNDLKLFKVKTGNFDIENINKDSIKFLDNLKIKI